LLLLLLLLLPNEKHPAGALLLVLHALAGSTARVAVTAALPNSDQAHIHKMHDTQPLRLLQQHTHATVATKQATEPHLPLCFSVGALQTFSKTHGLAARFY
jgi:hypothetical protein